MEHLFEYYVRMHKCFLDLLLACVSVQFRLFRACIFLYLFFLVVNVLVQSSADPESKWIYWASLAEQKSEIKNDWMDNYCVSCEDTQVRYIHLLIYED